MNQDPERNGDKDLIDVFDDAMDAGDLDLIKAELERRHASEIAYVLEALPGSKRDELWQYIGPELEGDVLSYAQDEVRARLLGQMEPSEVAAATEGLDIDDAADILQDLPEPVVDEVLRAMDAQDRQRLATVLSYPEDTAGGLMDLDTITVRSDVDIDVVLRYLRLRGELPENTDTLIVVDRNNIYQGLLRLSDVLTRDPDSAVAEVMDAQTAAIPADMPSNEIALLFEHRDLVTAPVVDLEGHLIGRITVDDVVDVIREQSDHSFMAHAGLDEEDDMFAPVLLSARRRAIWLGINLLTAFIAAWVIGRFEATIEKLVALAILMPVVASMGGIAGTQTLTIVIRGLALGQVGSANARSLMYKELGVAGLNGALWAVVVGLVAGFWFGDLGLGIVIAVAMIINLTTAAFAGALVPLALKRMKIDPAIAGGVVLTTVTDVIGFVAFLGIASIYLV